MIRDTPLIMLSGMGADARVFTKQLESLPNMIVPEWIDPLSGESLVSYAERLSEVVDPGEACFVGGASFGGFVALEMSKHLNTRGCVLVGSVRSPAELPAKFQKLREAAWAPDLIPFEIATLLSKVALLSSGAMSCRHFPELLRQVSESDAAFLRWACRALMGWEGGSHLADVAIHQIHGEKDFVLPLGNTTPDVVVSGAGHALSLSHPEEVTQFLVAAMKG